MIHAHGMGPLKSLWWNPFVFQQLQTFTVVCYISVIDCKADINDDSIRLSGRQLRCWLVLAFI